MNMLDYSAEAETRLRWITVDKGGCGGMDTATFRSDRYTKQAMVMLLSTTVLG